MEWIRRQLLRCATNVTTTGDLADGNAWGYCGPGCFDVEGKDRELIGSKRIRSWQDPKEQELVILRN